MLFTTGILSLASNCVFSKSTMAIFQSVESVGNHCIYYKNFSKREKQCFYNKKCSSDDGSANKSFVKMLVVARSESRVYEVVRTRSRVRIKNSFWRLSIFYFSGHTSACINIEFLHLKSLPTSFYIVPAINIDDRPSNIL